MNLNQKIVPLPSDIIVAPTAYPIKINGDSNCISYLTGEKVTVYNLDTLTINFVSKFGKIPVIAEVLDKSNIMAIVFSDNQKLVCIWDDNSKIIIKELEFDNVVTNLIFKGQFLTVITYQAVIIYCFHDFSLVIRQATGPNPLGLGHLNIIDSWELIIPSPEIGYINVVKPNKQLSFQVCMSSLSALTVNSNNNLIATASQKGTIIRVWDINSKQIVNELRRGLESTTIHTMAFNNMSNFLCVTSKTGTAHLYSLTDPQYSQKQYKLKTEKSNSIWKQTLKFVAKEIPKYLTSHHSFVQIPGLQKCLPIFHLDQMELILINNTGGLFKYRFAVEPPGYQQIFYLQLGT